MNGKIRVLAAAAALAAAAVTHAAPTDIDDIVSALRAIDCYHSTVSYSVTLPQAADDIRYSVNLESSAAPSDTLSPVDYVIDWTFRAPSGQTVSGFSAYYDGNHFRFRGDRLQEYHTAWDAVPFATKYQGGRAFPGVQRSVQFANLLPAFIALDLEEMAADSLYTITAEQAPEGQKRLRAVMTVGGVECLESVYTFEAASGRPLSISTDTNMGTISEQSMSARYVYPETDLPCTPVTEQALAERWPDEFSKFRESNFSIENLPGSPLPAFSLPTPDGHRITRTRGEAFGVPAAIVIVDPTKGFASETVDQVRRAADSLPYEPEVLWAVVSTHPETALALTGSLRSGESLGLNASGLARSCGAASLPVVVICNSDGTVADVVLGYNNDLHSVVMQKMSVLK